MTRSGIIFLIILILNALIAAVYLIWYLIFQKEQDHSLQFVMHTVVMLLCPIVGPLYFLFAFLKFRFLRLGERDLSDVEFSKKHHMARIKADEDRERNIVAMGEAILVSDQEKKRANMLNILLGETKESFSAIAQALNSDDSEVAHYAASFLQSKMDVFRENVRKKQRIIDAGNIEEEACQQQVLELIRYMDQMLKQKVFTQVEQLDYVAQMEQLCENLYQNEKNVFAPDCYECILGRMMEMSEYDKAELWANRFCEQYPDHLSSFKLRLKLYFETGRKDQFFAVLEQLRASTVVIDNQTLELIRMVRQ